MLVINNIRKILFFLSKKEKKHMYMLLVAIIVMGMLEVVGVTSVIPFMKVLTTPDIIKDNYIISYVYNVFNFQSINQFKVFLGFTVIFALIVSNAVSALTMRSLLRFTYRRNHSMAEKLLKDYIKRPYIFFLNNNSTDLSKNVLSEVQHVIDGVFVPGMKLLAKLAVSIFLLGAIFVVNPRVAAIVVFVLAISYVAIFKLFRSTLTRIGKLRVIANKKRFRSVGDLFGGIKDIKLLGRERAFMDEFTSSSMDFANCQISNQVISMLPRYLVESVVFGGAVLIVIIFMNRGNINEILTTMVFFALACYKLMPAIQQLFVSATKVNYNWPAVDVLYKDIEKGKELRTYYDENEMNGENSKIDFNDKLELRNISFHYPCSSNFSLENINLTIKKNTTVAIVGVTGCGKTTLVDIVMGILEPEEGSLVIDGNKIEKSTLKAWQKRVGYVPQHVYLSDSTIASNIAFGVKDNDIDYEGVKEVAGIANIHEFVENLSDGYFTAVGERGVRISGGQLQRIAIARALYSNPDVLIMDEATSSLDGGTEDVIMQAVRNISHRKTIIIIAHRLATVRDADVIYLLSDGKIDAKGKYDELIKSSSKFRYMAKLSQNQYSNI